MHLKQLAYKSLSFRRYAISACAVAITVILMLLARAPLMAASPDLSWAAVEDARKTIEAELSKFDGSVPPKKIPDLMNAIASFKAHMDILRARAHEHHYTPPNMGRLAVLCRKIDKASTDALATTIGNLERKAKEYEEAERRWTRNLGKARGKDALRLGTHLATAAITSAAASVGTIITDITDRALGLTTTTGRGSSDPIIKDNLAAIKRMALQEFQKSRGYPYDPKNPRNMNDHDGYIVIVQRMAPARLKEQLAVRQQEVANLKTRLKTANQDKAAYDANWADLQKICNDLDKVPGWILSPKPIVTPSPLPKPVPPRPPKPVPTGGPNCKDVPYIIDLSQAAATAAVTGAGLLGVKITGFKSSYYVAQGAVITQYPYVGDCVDPGTLVAIEVSDGAPQMQELIVEPAEVQIEIGETVEFSARMNYSDGSHNYLTYGSTWTPGPDHKFTGERGGTYTVIAAFQGLMGQATVTVGKRKIPRVTIPEGVRGQQATPADYVWNALCTPRSGEVTYGKDYNATRHKIMGGPFIGPRTAKKWIDANCPNWRCTTEGQCATQPAAAAPGTEGWSALCTRRTGEITIGKKANPTRHTVMAGPFLGEPDVRNWVASNCPSWRCTGNGQCAAAPGGTAAAPPGGGAGGGAGGQCDALRASQDSAFSQARGQYDAGNLSQAMSILRGARGKSETSPIDCGGSQRIADAISKIDRIRGVLDGIGAAIKACDRGKLGGYKRQISSLAAPHPLIAAKLSAIDKAEMRCGVKQANTDCQTKYGSGYRAGKPAADGSYYCIPNKAAANAKCRELNGAGWYAGKVRSDSTYDCHPGKSVRNADCRQKYGKGWYAGKARADGSYNCHMGKSARTASCRQQYGRGWYAGKLRRDGSFLCHGPRQTPRGPSGAEIGAAIAGAVIQGIIESQGGGGRGGGGGSPTPPPSSGQCQQTDGIFGPGCYQ